MVRSPAARVADPLRREAIASYLSICLALAMVVLLGVWGAVRDWTNVRTTLVDSELESLRSHAERTVFRIQTQLDETYPTPEERKTVDVNAIKTRGERGEWWWLWIHWERLIPRDRGRMYGAIVSPDGRIHRHSDRNMRDKPTALATLPSKLSLPEGVFQIRCPYLTGNRRSLDLRLPIRVGGERVIATYHSGLDADWIENQLDLAYQGVIRRWATVIGGIIVVVLFAAGSLYLIARHTAALRRSLEQADLRRVTELSQLMVGLAHEIRNPLNALRLNLHMAERVHRQEAWLPEEEVTTMLRDSTREVERIRDLMHEMLGYARTEPKQEEEFDLNAELKETMSLLKHVMVNDGITVYSRLPQQPTAVRMNRARLRQVLINLLNNARDAVGPGGRIDVELSAARGNFELVVEDNGPGVPIENRERIFEPFFSTKDQGTGLGLALVRKFVEEGGGQVHCESDGRSGSRFHVRLPEAPSALKMEVVG
jgi:signal transduction histidine kinase